MSTSQYARATSSRSKNIEHIIYSLFISCSFLRSPSAPRCKGYVWTHKAKKKRNELHVDEVSIRHCQGLTAFIYLFILNVNFYIFMSGEKSLIHIYRSLLKVITLISESLDLPDLIISGNRVIISEKCLRGRCFERRKVLFGSITAEETRASAEGSNTEQGTAKLPDG